MRTESVDILSDKTNAVIMRHPGRAFPGVLIQGDSLSVLCGQADRLCAEIGRGSPAFAEANDLRNALRSYLNHYKATLGERGIALPFSEDA
jgi:hypothetical protein